MEHGEETESFMRSNTLRCAALCRSRYETDATNGTAHFLEHMAFKGTAVRHGCFCVGRASIFVAGLHAMGCSRAPRRGRHGCFLGGARCVFVLRCMPGLRSWAI